MDIVLWVPAVGMRAGAVLKCSQGAHWHVELELVADGKELKVDVSMIGPPPTPFDRDASLTELHGWLRERWKTVTTKLDAIVDMVRGTVAQMQGGGE